MRPPHVLAPQFRIDVSLDALSHLRILEGAQHRVTNCRRQDDLEGGCALEALDDTAGGPAPP